MWTLSGHSNQFSGFEVSKIVEKHWVSDLLADGEASLGIKNPGFLSVEWSNHPETFAIDSTRRYNMWMEYLTTLAGPAILKSNNSMKTHHFSALADGWGKSSPGMKNQVFLG